MNGSSTAKVTISLPKELVVFADSLARERSTTRSAVIAEFLKEEEKARLHALMAEGYREMAEENLREAEQALKLTSEVILCDD